MKTKYLPLNNKKQSLFNLSSTERKIPFLISYICWGHSFSLLVLLLVVNQITFTNWWSWRLSYLSYYTSILDFWWYSSDQSVYVNRKLFKINQYSVHVIHSKIRQIKKNNRMLSFFDNKKRSIKTYNRINALLYPLWLYIIACQVYNWIISFIIPWKSAFLCGIVFRVCDMNHKFVYW